MKTIEEKNRMIAEFIGMQKTELGWYDNNEVLKLPNTSDNTFDDLLFHASWDWLMPVVEKIELLGYSVEKNFQHIDNDWQTLITKGHDILFQDFAKEGIDAIYCTVISFIEWYNENK